VESGVTCHGDVQIAYEDFGKPGGRPVLLISGLDSQMIGWPDGFCEALAGAGFHVVRYDHRDAGLSTHFTGKKRAYELTDMIDDMMAVLDAVGWESANLVGLSMGGGLAQFAALLRPERVRTLTAISAIPQYGQPVRLFRYIRFPGPFKLVFRRYGDSPEEKQRMLIDVTGSRPETSDVSESRLRSSVGLRPRRRLESGSTAKPSAGRRAGKQA
jgi:pimeloyl-ACP methyl ester carboxylesterase